MFYIGWLPTTTEPFAELTSTNSVSVAFAIIFAIVSLLQDRHTSPLADNLAFATRPLKIFKTMVEESVVLFSLEFNLSLTLSQGLQKHYSCMLILELTDDSKDSIFDDATCME
jgi:hypothetical protein